VIGVIFLHIGFSGTGGAMLSLSMIGIGVEAAHQKEEEPSHHHVARGRLLQDVDLTGGFGESRAEQHTGAHF
jgi:hypothetical protein